MKVKEWMSYELITVRPTTAVSDAWDLMRQRRVEHLLVMDERSLVGIISDRDIRLTLPSPATSFSAGEITYRLGHLTVDRVMTRSPITIGADRPLRDAVALMLLHRISALPVVDRDRVVGIIPQTDLLLAFPTALREADTVTSDRDAAARAEPPIRHTILVPVDRMGTSDGALIAARELATRASAVLRLLHVAPDPAPVVIDRRTVSYSDQEVARARDEALMDVRAMASTVKGVPVQCAVRFGVPAEEIVREAEDANADLIVMATRRRTGVRRLLQGSVAETVERTTTRPVLLVPFDADEGDEESLASTPDRRAS